MATVLAATAAGSVSQPDPQLAESEMPPPSRLTSVVDYARPLALAAAWPAPCRTYIDNQAVWRELETSDKDRDDGDDSA